MRAWLKNGGRNLPRTAARFRSFFGFNQMKDGHRDFNISHVLFVLAAGFAVRILWRQFGGDDGGGNCNALPPGGSSRDGLLRAIAHGAGRPPWIYIEKYKPGLPGIERTLQVMRAIVRSSAADPAIRQAAASIVGKCAGHQFRCEVFALYEFVRDRITYRRDPAGYEWVQDSRRTLALGFGDCDDKSVLLGSLLAALGHRPRFAVLGYKPGEYSHVYVEVFDNSKWVPLDPTNEHAAVGWQGRAVSRGVYEIFK